MILSPNGRLAENLFTKELYHESFFNIKGYENINFPSLAFLLKNHREIEKGKQRK